MSSRISLIGVPFDPVTKDGAVARLLAFLAGNEKHHVMTPNNEMLVEARRNPAFHAVLQQSALNLPDSTGIVLAARLTGQRLPERVPGVDIVTALCDRLSADQSVFLLGAAPGVAERAAQELCRNNPRLVIAGTHAGSPTAAEAHAIIERINASGARLLLVAYGAPAQDLWIASHLSSLQSVRVAIGVGGTFDFLAGTVKRAPRMLRAIGLEWLWRLILQPRRWRRIWNAVVVFPCLVLLHGKGEQMR